VNILNYLKNSKKKKNDDKIVYLSIVLGFVMLIVLILSIKTKFENKAFEVLKSNLDGTLWVYEGISEGEQSEIRFLHFRDKNKVLVKNIDRGEVYLYDYDYDKENDKGLIYLYSRKDVLVVLEHYSFEDMLTWNERIVERFEKKKNLINYLGKEYKKRGLDYVLKLDKNFR